MVGLREYYGELREFPDKSSNFGLLYGRVYGPLWNCGLNLPNWNTVVSIIFNKKYSLYEMKYSKFSSLCNWLNQIWAESTYFILHRFNPNYEKKSLQKSWSSIRYLWCRRMVDPDKIFKWNMTPGFRRSKMILNSSWASLSQTLMAQTLGDRGDFL